MGDHPSGARAELTGDEKVPCERWGPSRHGHMFVIGKNMANGCEDRAIISWNDPKTGSWIPELENEAGNLMLPFPIPPDAPKEDGGRIRFGDRFELRYQGLPFVYGAFIIDEDWRKEQEKQNRIAQLD